MAGAGVGPLPDQPVGRRLDRRDRGRRSREALAFSGAKDCPHIRKSLKFKLTGQKVVIQISNAAAPDIILVALPE